MDMLFVNLVCIVLLFIASIQDMIKKSVSDFIHYSLLIFSISFIVLSILYNSLPSNILFGYFILLMFVFLYSFRLLAIGDLYIMFFLFYFLSYQSFTGIFKFLIGLSFFGSMMQSLEAIRVYYKKKDHKKIAIFVFSVFLIISSLIFLIYSLEDIVNRYIFLLLSLSLLLPTLIIFKLYEEKIRENLTFRRKVDELVEGDWIEGEVEIKNLDLLDELKQNFLVINRDGKYFIRFNRPNIKRKILIILISAFPLIFLNNQFLFAVSILISILISTIMHDRLFNSDLGLSKKQIEILKKAFKGEEFIVREGAPFVPAIFLSYLISII